MPERETIIDRQFLEKLERLTIHWQKSFPGLVGGHNVSRFSGPGQEFLDHRHFHHGDDLRAVNWRAYLRLEKLFLKMFQVEPRIPVRVLVDASLSMTTGAREKLRYARQLAAALTYIGLVRLDTISLQSFSDSLSDPLVCSGGRHRFGPAVDFLSAMVPKGRTQYLEVARQFLGRYAQRGLAIVISDFLDDRGCEKPLEYVADFGHEILLVHVWADEDRQPPWTGELDLVDSETGDRIEISADDSVRQAYTEAFDAFAGQLQSLALRNGGRYVGISTSTSIEEAMFVALMRARGVE